MLESLYVFITNLQTFLVKLQLILLHSSIYQLIKISKKYHLGWRGCGAVKYFEKKDAWSRAEGTFL